MTDRPILFSAPMVRAIIREIEHPGTGKTQTRRVIDFDGIDKVIEFVRVAFDRDSQVPIYEMKEAAGKHVYRPAGRNMQTPHWSPRYAVGDRLWVRENLAVTSNDQSVRWLYYAADGKDVWPQTRWQKDRNSVPSIHMPREFSRLTLFVTDVRVQRLQEISEADARAEGISPLPAGRYYCGEDEDGPVTAKSAITAYGWLWNSINGERPGCHWQDNPWVVAVTFDPALGNIDQVRP